MSCFSTEKLIPPEYIAGRIDGTIESNWSAAFSDSTSNRFAQPPSSSHSLFPSMIFSPTSAPSSERTRCDTRDPDQLLPFPSLTKSFHCKAGVADASETSLQSPSTHHVSRRPALCRYRTFIDIFFNFDNVYCRSETFLLISTQGVHCSSHKFCSITMLGKMICILTS